MRVLITGGAGFIGYHLARFHAGCGDTVSIVDNLFKSGGTSDGALDALARDSAIRLHHVDLAAPLTGLDDVGELDVVYHLAAINGTRLFYEIPYQVARNNLLSTINLLDWLKGRSFGRLVYSSTSEVYAGGESLSLLKIPTDETASVVFPQPTPTRFSYGTSKFQGEFLCFHLGKLVGRPVSVVRYHNIYGERMGKEHVIPQFIARVKEGERPFRIYGGQETRAFCYVSDAIEATAAVANAPDCAGEIVHIGNPTEEIEIASLAKLVMELHGISVDLEECGRRQDSVARRCPDISKLARLTGFQPKVSLREGLLRTIAWYRDHL